MKCMKFKNIIDNIKIDNKEYNIKNIIDNIKILLETILNERIEKMINILNIQILK